MGLVYTPQSRAATRYGLKCMAYRFVCTCKRDALEYVEGKRVFAQIQFITDVVGAIFICCGFSMLFKSLFFCAI